MATDPGSDELRPLLSDHFGHLGRARSIVPLALDFKVSNRLFVYETDQGRFVIKRMISADALYGHTGSAERLEVVAQATRALRAAGLPVEAIVAGGDGRCVQRLGDELVRVYCFEDGHAFTGLPDQIRASAHALRRLHQEGLATLPAEIAAQLRRFAPAYPLSGTAQELPELHERIRQAASEPVFAGILEQWEIIDRSVQVALAHTPQRPIAATTVHTDAHPRNTIQREGAAILIDLDNLIIDRPFKCLGFSILRFGFFGRARTRAALTASIAHWCTPEQREDRSFMDDLAHGMLRLEAEKVVRILLRYFRTGTYADFVANVGPVHLANLTAILPLCAGQEGST
jgi:hypothetical protein